MVGIIIPGAAERRSIRVDTRKGTHVDNAQSFEITVLDQHLEAEHSARFTNALFRTELSPVYNCHGLTFASRRTRIPEAQSVRTILAEDDYEEVQRADVRVGDVILYVSADDDGDIEHSGVSTIPGDIGGALQDGRGLIHVRHLDRADDAGAAGALDRRRRIR